MKHTLSILLQNEFIPSRVAPVEPKDSKSDMF
jgi:hypothetical protein